ncbi:MAG: hypothetical protein Q9208_005311 [Pyrenodesmia sp. 3 TL-2023]
MLDTLYGALVKAVQDAQSDIPSPAYRTFLKDPESAGMVSDILSQAAAGATIYPPNPYTDGAPSPPVIVCLDRMRPPAGDQNNKPFTALEACLNPESQPGIGTSAMQVAEIIHLYLWPEEQKRGVFKHLDVYDANDVLTLSPQDAVMNAASYVLYVASN